MSLVLDTNAGDDLYSSDVITGGIKYPDFNQLLLKPNFGTNNNIANVVVETINGTNINGYFADMSRNAYYNVNAQVGGIDGGIYSSGTGATNIVGPIYFISHGSFKGGEIIGKDIVFAIMMSCYSNSDNATITESVGLMHTDGTYSEIDAETLHQTVSNFNPSQASTSSGAPQGTCAQLYEIILKHKTTQGMVAQAGDKICLKITNRKCVGGGNAIYQRSYSSFGMTSSGLYSTQRGYTNGVYYGDKYMPITSPCTPVQVSIE